MIPTLTPRLGFLFLSSCFVYKLFLVYRNIGGICMTLEILKGFGLLICCLRFLEQEDKPSSVIIFFFVVDIFYVVQDCFRV